MKAIRIQTFGNPEVMQLEDVADLPPSGNQVLVDVKAIGVNPVDCYIRAGIYPVKPLLPYTPGLDASGVIVAVGPQVSQYKAGDRVYCFGSETGCYAEHLLADQSQCYPLPATTSFTAGASLGVPYATAYYALFYRAQVHPGETLLVHGASGAVGLAALQIAKAHGIRTIGTAGTQAGLDLIRAQGAISALDHTKPNYLDAIAEQTDGQGVNVILEMLANVNLEKDLNILTKFGRVVVIGNRGAIEIDPRAIMGRNGSILGMSLFNVTAKELDTIHAALYAGLQNGSLNPVINTEMELADAAHAHIKVMAKGAKGKIILLP